MARRRRYVSHWAPYVPVAERRREAAKLAAERRRDGREFSPVEITAQGRAIAATFWGKSWCENLERYSDFSNRLPRGRTYVRNGSVIDLQVAAGKVSALVSGSSVYKVEIRVEPLAAARWRRLRADCSGGIESLVELLQGRVSTGVMKHLCCADTGMFPEPSQISMKCSCPDWATLCKHVAAVLYGVGARLDREPELLFVLRQVDQQELVSASVGGIGVATAGAGGGELEGQDLGALFGIEFAETAAEPVSAPKAKRTARPKPVPKPKPTAKPGRKSKRPRAKPALDPTLTATELRERGVPNHVAQSWLRQGLIEHSGLRGIYVRTAASEALVRRYLTAATKGRGPARPAGA